MNKWDEILRWCRNHEKYVRLAVIAIVVITALVFFGAKGEKEEIVVVQNGEESIAAEAVDERAEEETEVQEEVNPDTKFIVDIDGCVKNPGIYEIAEGTRLYEVIEMAGGLTESAETTLINQAEVLGDGQKIIIPEQSTDASSLTPERASDGRININLADADALQEIPSVGPATAEKILAYRESNGRFQSIEDIKNVSGIGEKTFEKMKDKITI